MRIFERIISIPLSLYVCLRLLPFKQAIILPIIVRYNCKLKSLKGYVVLSSKTIKPNMLSIGFGKVGVFDKRYSRTILEINGKMIVHGKATFGHGSKICILREGILEIGNQFSNTAECTIICEKKITIGDRALVSWNTLIMDTDFHECIHLDTNTIPPKTKEIIIGSQVWIGTRSVILKGSYIPDGCIIGAASVVNKIFNDNNCLLAGNPATIRKREITLNIS